MTLEQEAAPSCLWADGLLLYYAHARGCGHTRAAVNGLTPSRGGFLVCHSEHYASEIRRQFSVDTIALSALESADGVRRRPLLLDNGAVIQMCNEVNALRAAFVTARDEVFRSRLALTELTRQSLRYFHSLRHESSRVKDFEALLRKRGRRAHDSGCPGYYWEGQRECICGVDQLLAEGTPGCLIQ